MWNRRGFLRLGVVAGAGAVLAACTPTVVEKGGEKEVTKIVKEVVKETVMVAGTPKVVEKEVTKVVKETVVVEKAPEGPVELQFWSYGMPMPGDEWPKGKWEQMIVDEYKEIRPNVNIDFTAMG